MFISKVILQDFQSHSYSEFNLDKGLNILTGISNQGKTSLVRALSLLLLNQWDKSWVRNGEKFCKVTIYTDTGIIVERQKGLSVNKYILTLPGSQPQIYENFGITTPEAVQKALRIHEVQIDSKDSINLNMSLQLEPLFLLSATNSYKAKIFGKLSGAHVLDTAIRELNREGRSFSTEKGIKEKELIELQGQVDKLVQIERFSTDMVEIEARLSSLSVQEGRLEAVRSLLERVKDFKATWTQEAAKEAVLNQFDTSLIAELALKIDKIKVISLLSSRIVNTELLITKQDKFQDLLAQVDLSSISVLAEKAVQVKTVRNLYIKFDKNQKELVSKTYELESTEKQYVETTKQYSHTLKEIGICPFCGVSTKDLSNVG